MLSSDENETCPNNNLVHLPAADELSLNLLLEQFIKDNITLSNSYNDTNYIKHWAHEEHDLKLITINELYDGKNDDDEILLLCEGCVKPIRTHDSLSYYGCVPCKYFMSWLERLSITFARVKRYLQIIKYSQPFKLFRCDGCGIDCNGVFYGNDIFYDESMTPSGELSICLDIGCVSLPKVIKHQAHHHQLDQVCCFNKCNACHRYKKLIKCRCEKCKFSICGRCIVKARTYKHRWDPHPLDLIYDAGMVEEHEHDFDCEYCSREIDTNTWFYHCSKCDLSLHPDCLEWTSYRHRQYVKFGATDIYNQKRPPSPRTHICFQQKGSYVSKRSPMPSYPGTPQLLKTRPEKRMIF